jgi:hypothetical protein
MQPDDLLAESARMAGAIAETEEKVAATLDHAAKTHPDRAQRLRALSESARAPREPARSRVRCGLALAAGQARRGAPG